MPEIKERYSQRISRKNLGKIITVAVLVSVIFLGIIYSTTSYIFDKNLVSEMDNLVRTHEIKNYSIEKEKTDLLKTKYKVSITHKDSLKDRYPNEFYIVKPLFNADNVDVKFESQK